MEVTGKEGPPLYDENFILYQMFSKSGRQLTQKERKKLHKRERERERENQPNLIDRWSFVGAKVYMIIVLTGLTITANVAPDLELPGLFWEGHKLSDIAIVEKIHLLNATLLVVILALILQTSLLYVRLKGTQEVFSVTNKSESTCDSS